MLPRDVILESAKMQKRRRISDFAGRVVRSCAALRGCAGIANRSIPVIRSRRSAAMDPSAGFARSPKKRRRPFFG